MAPVSSAVLGREVVGTALGVYTEAQIKAFSVLTVREPQLFDNLGRPVPGGLYDPRLGPLDRQGTCSTCGLNQKDCPGHFGHIELVVPVYNPVFFKDMFRLLKCLCFSCHRLRMQKQEVRMYAAKLKLLRKGLVTEAFRLSDALDMYRSARKKDVGKAALQSMLETALEEADEALATAEDNADAADMNVESYVAETIQHFFSSMPMKTCHNCRAPELKLRSHQNAKVFVAAPKVASVMDGVYAAEVGAEHMLEEDGGAGDAADAGGASGEHVGTTPGKRTKMQAKKDQARAKAGMQKYLHPLELQQHMKLLWEKERELMGLLFACIHAGPNWRTQTSTSSEVFFLNTVTVPPSRFRPPSMHGGMVFESPQNQTLSSIIKANNQLIDLSRLKQAEKDKAAGGGGAASDVADGAGGELPFDLAFTMNRWVELQTHVNQLFDNRFADSNQVSATGVKQILEKKEGLFRKHMMGKRVNYAARSVISPDPYLETNEIGIPLYFAKRLTYPQPVTPWNVSELRQAVVNGAAKYPGANFVEDERGNLIDLSTRSHHQRVALSKTLLTGGEQSSGQSRVQVQDRVKRVYRHVNNGDPLIVNRQPTLHKPSMMCHKARVLVNERTIRMHYANCKTYNADFDGDEINLHYPQNELARSEATHIANVDNQYIVPTNGAPIRGLIQDHVLTGVLLTKKDTFFTRAQYQQLVFVALTTLSSRTRHARIECEPPAVLKPQRLWTGKQVVTTVLKQLTRGMPAMTMSGKCKIPPSIWGKGSQYEGPADKDDLEGIVTVRHNELLTGVLDKSQFGSTTFGMVHCYYELYGAEAAGILLSSLGRLFTVFLQQHGFTCGIEDFVLNDDAEKYRVAVLHTSALTGHTVAANVAGAAEDDDEMKVRERVRQSIFREPDFSDRLDASMKGALNPLASNIIKYSLPARQRRLFPHNNLSLMVTSGAKGSKVNFSQISCLLGQQELEGHRVPVMVSGKTLPAFEPYDTSARAGGFVSQRFLTGIRPQEYFFHCMAGREGLVDTAVKTSRSGYLQRCLIKHMESLSVQYDYTVRDADNSVVQFHYGEDALDVTKVKFLDRFAFLADNYASLEHRYGAYCDNDEYMDTRKVAKLRSKMAKGKHADVPVISVLSPGRHLGAVSEHFQDKLSKYIADNPDGVLAPQGPIDPKRFERLMWHKYGTSLAAPGESVGLLAGQSVGEPSTQMTLNTFHLAGVGGVNMTLGIPRLREILMTASANISTPSMLLPLLPGVSRKQAERFCARITRLALSELVEKVEVSESLPSAGVSASGLRRDRVYDITLQLFPKKYCAVKVKMSKVERAVKVHLVQLLNRAITRDIKRQGAEDGSALASKEAGGKDAVEDDDEEDDDEEDDDEEDEEDEEDDDDEEEEDASGAEDEEDLGTSASKKSKKHKRKANKASKKKSKDKKKKGHTAGAVEIGTPAAQQRPMEKGHVKMWSVDHDTRTVTLRVVMDALQKKLMMTKVVSRVLDQVLVINTPGIRRVVLLDKERALVSGEKRLALQTQGVNFAAMLKQGDEVVDLDQTSSNDIWAVLRTYGVEAARRVIVSEVVAVFDAYGIGVDPRHISLIGDVMTFHGGFRPYNRMGIVSNVSPLLKASFETSTTFLKNGALAGTVDQLKTPSACLVMGKVARAGTGAFDVMQPLVTEKEKKV